MACPQHTDLPIKLLKGILFGIPPSIFLWFCIIEFILWVW